MFKKWTQSTRLHFYSIGVIIMLLLTTMATVISILSSREAEKTAEKRRYRSSTRFSMTAS